MAFLCCHFAFFEFAVGIGAFVLGLSQILLSLHLSAINMIRATTYSPTYKLYSANRSPLG